MLSSEKRTHFHSSIRKKQITVLMTPLRYKLLKQQTHHHLSLLIQSTHSSASPLQINKLISWANLGQENALIHIGNLLLDDIIKCEDIGENLDLRRNGGGQGKYRGWVLCIMYEKGFFGGKQFICLMQQIVQREINEDGMDNLEENDFLLKAMLPVLKQILKNHEQAYNYLFSLDNKPLFSELSQLFMEIVRKGIRDKKVEELSLSVLNLILSQQNGLSRFIQVFGIQSIYQLIQTSLLKVSSKSRALGIQIASNILVTQSAINQDSLIAITQQSNRMCSKLLEIFQKEKHSNRVEISYFLLNYVSFFSPSKIIDNPLYPILIKQVKKCVLNTDERSLEIYENFQKILSHHEQNCLCLQMQSCL